MLIAIAGPYSAETEEHRVRHLTALNHAASEVLRRGHIPVVGVNAALPVVSFLDPEERDEAIMAISTALLGKCDALLVIGSSPGADRERDLAAAKGIPIYRHIDEIPK